MGGRVSDALRVEAGKLAESSIVYEDSNGTKLADNLIEVANFIDQEHAQRMKNCRRSVRRDFANYLRSVIADYEKGVSRRNRNHAHCVETIDEEDGIVGHARCSVCQQAISSYDSFCRHCGAKITGTDYRHEGE